VKICMIVAVIKTAGSPAFFMKKAMAMMMTRK
jgi:hypothetical protein